MYLYVFCTSVQQTRESSPANMSRGRIPPRIRALLRAACSTAARPGVHGLASPKPVSAKAALLTIDTSGVGGPPSGRGPDCSLTTEYLCSAGRRSRPEALRSEVNGRDNPACLAVAQRRRACAVTRTATPGSRQPAAKAGRPSASSSPAWKAGASTKTVSKAGEFYSTMKISRNRRSDQDRRPERPTGPEGPLLAFLIDNEKQ